MNHKHEASANYPTRCNHCGCSLAHDECESEASTITLGKTPTYQTTHETGTFESLWLVVVFIAFIAVCIVAAIWLAKLVWGLRLLILACGPFALTFYIFTRDKVPYFVSRFVAGLGCFYLANSIMFHSIAGRVTSVISLGDFGQITLTLAVAMGFAIWYFSGRFENKYGPWTLLLAAGSSGWFLLKIVLIGLKLSPWLTHGSTDFIISGDGP